jgi:hypothetical protein
MFSVYIHIAFCSMYKNAFSVTFVALNNTYRINQVQKNLKFCITHCKSLDPSLGDMPQGALSVSSKHDVIPLGNLLRQVRHTEFYLRIIAGTGPGVPNLEHGVPNLKHGVPFKNQRLYSAVYSYLFPFSNTGPFDCTNLAVCVLSSTSSTSPLFLWSSISCQARSSSL